MKKTLFKSTVLLIIISIIAKILSFGGRIILARTLSNEAMSYYSLASSTMIFVITIVQIGIPTALSKLIAQKQERKAPLYTSMFIAVFNNLIIVTLFFFIIPWMAHVILKQDVIIPVLYAILPLLPMVSLSGILKGYLYGIQNHNAAATSQIYEELSRIIFLVIIFQLYPTLDAVGMARIAMLSITIGELFSAFYMLFHIIKNKKKATSFKGVVHKQDFVDLLSISLPMTGSRLIGSLTYFLEPIVMVAGLSLVQNQAIVATYGQLNGYVLPIITMPSFITVSLSNYLLPSFTYHFSRNNIAHAKKLCNLILSLCFVIGISSSLLCYLFPEQLLQLFYHNTTGAAQLKQLAWPFALYSLQPPLSSMMHSLSKSNSAMIDTFLGSLIRILCVAFLSTYTTSSLAIGLTCGMIVTTLLHGIKVTIAMAGNNVK